MCNRKIKIGALLMAAVLAVSPMSVAAEDAEKTTSPPGTEAQSREVQEDPENPGGQEESEKAQEDIQVSPEEDQADTKEEPPETGSVEENSIQPIIYDLANDRNISVRFRNNQQTFTYTGSEIKPEIEVVYTDDSQGGQETLLDLEHYNISYKNHVNVGVASVTIEGKDSQGQETQGPETGSSSSDSARYIGTKTLEYMITPASVNECQIQLSDASYTGKNVVPSAKVVYQGRTLAEGIEYRLLLSDNKEMGTATAKIEGIGNFTGTVSGQFRILPAAPSIKTKATAYNKIKLSWNKTKKAAGYEIQRSASPSSGFKKIKKFSSGSKKSYTNSGVSCGKNYYYRIRSYAKVKTKGKARTKTKKIYSPWSDVVVGATKLGVPKISSAKGTSKTAIKVSWKKCKGAKGYEVYRSDRIDGDYIPVGITTRTSFANKMLGANTTWYYKVRAYRKLGGTKVYGAFSKVKKGKVKATRISPGSSSGGSSGNNPNSSNSSGSGSGSNSIYSSNRLAQLFPEGVPTSAEAMQKYLVEVTVPICDSSGNNSTMTLKVHKDLKDKISAIFGEMYSMGFPISASGTYAYSWRVSTGGSGMSHHSYGVVVDINPASNPMEGYTNGTYAPYKDPYSVTPGVVAVWAKYGFYWGGNFARAKDYMHFSYTGY